MHFLLLNLLTLLSGMLVDLCYTAWVRKISSDNKHLAGLCSAAIGIFGALGLAGVVQDLWLLPAYAVGLYAGTYLGCKYVK